MKTSEPVEQLRKELLAVVWRYSQESDITVAQTLSAVKSVKDMLAVHEESNSYDWAKNRFDEYRYGDHPIYGREKKLPNGCVRCMTAFERVQHTFSEATKLGLDFPTDKMLEDMIRDAEWNALWNPIDIAQQHDQDMTVMREIWLNAAMRGNDEPI